MAMGDLYLFQKDQKQAGEEFKKAADLAPVRSIERLKYAAFKWQPVMPRKREGLPPR